MPRGVFFHDWWLYLVVSAFGTVVYDVQPSLLYRQHATNVIGHGTGWLGRQRGVVRYLLRHDWVGILQMQVFAFLQHYGNSLPPHTRNWVLRYFHGTDGMSTPRWRLVFTPRRWRQTFFGDIALRLLLVAYKLRLWPLPGRRF